MTTTSKLKLDSNTTILKTDKYNFFLKNKKIIILNNKTSNYLNNYLKTKKSDNMTFLIDYLIKNKFLLSNIKRTKLRKSTSLTIAVTSKCNLGCLYCYADANKNPKTITKEIYKLAIDNFLSELFSSNEEISLVLHGGGEPTLNSNLFIEIIKYFQKKCEALMLTHSVSFITNGTFDNKIREFLKTSKVIKSISLSLDGIEEIQNEQRPFIGGKGSFNTILKNIEFLKILNKKVYILSVVSENSLDYIIDTIKMAKKYNIVGIKFDPIIESPRSLRKGLKGVDLDKFTLKLFEAFKLGIKLGVEVKSSFLTILNNSTIQACGTINAMPVITPEGNITSCYEVLEEKDPAFNTFKLGKVQKGENIIFKENVDFLKSRTSDNISECDTCFLKYTCAGGCSVQSYRKENDIFSVLKAECDAKRELNKNIIEYIYENKELFKDEYEIKEFL